jgi:peptidoglycan/xylan/chitin deacetylase (PgdA/CDA1 family)
MRTIDWDVDPRDWSRPGTRALANRVISHVHPGAIVVMHDGGGGRGQTVAALPIILRRLHRRGYRAVTVTELLGGREIWRTG